jgi:hypothetical protein
VLALRGALAAAAGVCIAVGALGCKAKVSPSQCDQLLDRYASLVVREKYPDAAPDQVRTEQQREKGEARGDDGFKNCSSEVSLPEFDCAMRASTADALEKCLE